MSGYDCGHNKLKFLYQLLIGSLWAPCHLVTWTVTGNGRLPLPQLSCCCYSCAKLYKLEVCWNVLFYHTSAGVDLWFFFLKCMVFTSSSDVIGVFTVDSLDWTWNFIWKQKQNKKEIRLQPHVVLLCTDVEDFAKGKYVAFSVVTSDLLYEMHIVVAAMNVCLKVEMYLWCLHCQQTE